MAKGKNKNITTKRKMPFYSNRMLPHEINENGIQFVIQI
jgi:hypothetical protein